MRTRYITKTLLICTFMSVCIANAQSISGLEEIDKDFLTSLPDEVREDVMKELEENLEQESNEFPRRPSSELSKLETVREWEEFKKETKHGKPN